MKDVKLVLENGMVFTGNRFGSHKNKVGELVFNTSMVGYQEIISDLSYFEQFVVMTYPLIGNYGITQEDFESRVPAIGCLIVKEINHEPSNFRYTNTLSEVMSEYGIPGISGVDTRKLTRVIRTHGSMKCMIADLTIPDEDCLMLMDEYQYPTNQIEQVTCQHKWYSKTKHFKYNVVAIDCGIKQNIVRKLNEKECNVLVVPYGTSSSEIMGYHPDGVFLSNGPGNPEHAIHVINNVKELQGRVPIFGICLGHQIIALANQAQTYKLKFGHRGGNHPVQNCQTGLVEITSQNHSYTVDPATLFKSDLEVTHINILDQTVEGLMLKREKVFSVQYHPESAPGPHDSDYLFDTFIQNMKEFRGI